jgi:ABC-2 type transport system permease protein
MELIENDKADLILEIPKNFESNLYKEKETKLFLAVNAINGVKANLGAAYMTNIVQAYNADFRIQTITPGRFHQLVQSKNEL